MNTASSYYEPFCEDVRSVNRAFRTTFEEVFGSPFDYSLKRSIVDSIVHFCWKHEISGRFYFLAYFYCIRSNWKEIKGIRYRAGGADTRRKIESVIKELSRNGDSPTEQALAAHWDIPVDVNGQAKWSDACLNRSMEGGRYECA